MVDLYSKGSRWAASGVTELIGAFVLIALAFCRMFFARVKEKKRLGSVLSTFTVPWFLVLSCKDGM